MRQRKKLSAAQLLMPTELPQARRLATACVAATPPQALDYGSQQNSMEANRRRLHSECASLVKRMRRDGSHNGGFKGRPLRGEAYGI